MKVYIYGDVYDTEKDDVVILCFDSDDNRKQHALNLSNMKEKEGKRFYACYNKDVLNSKDIEEIFDRLEKTL